MRIINISENFWCLILSLGTCTIVLHTFFRKFAYPWLTSPSGPVRYRVLKQFIFDSGSSEPEWKLEYSLTSVFRVPDASPASMHQILQSFKQEGSTDFEKYQYSMHIVALQGNGVFSKNRFPSLQTGDHTKILDMLDIALHNPIAPVELVRMHLKLTIKRIFGMGLACNNMIS